MVRAIAFTAIIALVAIYSRGAAAKTPVHPSIDELAIAKHAKDIDDENRLGDSLHHRDRRSPGGDVGYSGGGGSGDHQSSSTSIASDNHAVPIGVDGRHRISRPFSESQISRLKSAFDFRHYITSVECKELAGALGLTEKQVKRWFGKQRAKKCRKENLPGHVDGRHRISRPFSESQISRLKSAFDFRHYITSVERKELAGALGLTEKQVKRWFGKQRAKKCRKEKLPGHVDGRHRISRPFSESQISRLKSAFDFRHYITSVECKELAGALGLTEKQVKRWFGKQRAKKCRKEKLPGHVDGRHRISRPFSESQISRLKSAFDFRHYITSVERKELAGALGLTEKQVKRWFGKQRAKKCRKEKLPGHVDGRHRISRPFSESQISRLKSAFDFRHYITSVERKELAGALGLTEKQIIDWFARRRYVIKREHTAFVGGLEAANMPIVLRKLYHNATGAGSSGNGIAGSVASSVAPSSVSANSLHNVGVSTSDCGRYHNNHHPSHVEAHDMPTDHIPETYDFYHQHQYEEYPLDVESRNIPTHHEPTIFDPHHQHYNDHHIFHVEAPDMPTDHVPEAYDFYHQHQFEEYPLDVESRNIPTHHEPTIFDPHHQHHNDHHHHPTPTPPSPPNLLPPPYSSQ